MNQEKPRNTSCPDLRAELALAEEMQRKLYPGHAPPLAGFDIGGLSRPVEATNGDCFDYIPLPDGALGVVVGDVRGHGLPAALVMVQARAYLRAYATCETDVAKIIQRTNVALARDESVGYFVTCLLMRLEPGGRSLSYVNAGHPPGIVVGTNGERRELSGNSPLLGVMLDAEFEVLSTGPLEAGDRVALFTDGVIESRAPDGEFFGPQRVASTIAHSGGASAAAISEQVLAAADAFRGGTPQQDDMTCVAIKRDRLIGPGVTSSGGQRDDLE
ncbi:MAG TPA: PP2C family protein-serine/threonine phosphatase [Phycisphaerae bacterium]|nr:PP2C family protein-serine/threonine phosphatase [Phycisphaerae bacterium]